MNTILSKLEKARVFDVRQTPNGTFRFRDRSDGAFECVLTQDELMQLAQDLFEIADGFESVPPVDEDE